MLGEDGGGRKEVSHNSIILLIADCSLLRLEHSGVASNGNAVAATAIPAIKVAPGVCG